MEGSTVVRFLVLFPEVLDACRPVVAVADETEVFKDNADDQPETGKENPDRACQVTDNVFHVLVPVLKQAIHQSERPVLQI